MAGEFTRTRAQILPLDLFPLTRMAFRLWQHEEVEIMYHLGPLAEGAVTMATRCAGELSSTGAY